MIMDTNTKMPHKNILFLYYISAEKKKQLQEKGFDYEQYISQIKAIPNVEVREGINREALALAEQYSIVIILGHEVMGCIESDEDLLFPMAMLPSAFSPDYAGIIDVSVCGSDLIHDALKQRCPKAKVQASRGTTQLELRLYLYPKLLTHPNLKDNYSIVYNRIQDAIFAEQERRDSEELSKLKESTKLGKNLTSIIAPNLVRKTASFPIQVHVLPEGKKLTTKWVINGEEESPLKQYLDMDLKDGDIVSVKLSFSVAPRKHEDEYTKYLHAQNPEPLVWRETSDGLITIYCLVDEDFSLPNFIARFTMEVNGMMVFSNWSIYVNIESKNISQHILEPSSETVKPSKSDSPSSGVPKIELREEQKNMLEEIEKERENKRQETLGRLLKLAEKGDWKDDNTCEEVKQMLLTILGKGEIQLKDKEVQMSDQLWELLENGRGNRVEIVWQNIVGFLDENKLFNAKSAPELNKDFFGTKKGSDNINKGRSTYWGNNYRLGKIGDLLKAYCPKKK